MDAVINNQKYASINMRKRSMQNQPIFFLQSGLFNMFLVSVGSGQNKYDSISTISFPISLKNYNKLIN